MIFKKKTLVVALASIVATGFTSCADDEFTASIFDSQERPLDKTLYTYPLDTFLKVNYLEPYNLQFVYQMEDVATDMQRNLTPARYEKALDLAVLSKYMWFDVYKEHAGELFLKKYAPRRIHVIGSASYDRVSGEETLGSAEGGAQINLMKTNALDVEDIEELNNFFFGTMHHEFAHILDQNNQRPKTEFDEISKTTYIQDWTNQPDSLVLGLGFITPYGGSQAREDWAEIVANYITLDERTWDKMLSSAEYDWEVVDIDGPKIVDGYSDLDKTLGYIYMKPDGSMQFCRKVVVRDGEDHAIPDENGNPQYLDNNKINGKEVILKKLQLARDYYMNYYKIDLNVIRKMVQERQYVTNEDGTFKFDEYGMYINKLTQIVPGTNKTLIDVLRDEVNKYKEELNNNQ